MTQRKKLNETHSALVTHGIGCMKARSLDKFYEVELELIETSRLTSENLDSYNQIIDTDTQEDSQMSLDKLRLAIIQVQNQSSMTRVEALGLRNKLSQNSKLATNELLILDLVIQEKFSDGKVIFSNFPSKKIFLGQAKLND